MNKKNKINIKINIKLMLNDIYAKEWNLSIANIW